MSKKILVIYYTQSGQLENILDRFTAPLIEAGNVVEKVRVHVANDYPFPWTGKSFFAVMPDCVLGVPTVDYFIYAIFNWISPFMTLTVAALGIKIKQLTK